MCTHRVFFGPVPATPKTGARIMGEISQTLKASAHDAHYFAIIPGYRGTHVPVAAADAAGAAAHSLRLA